MANDISNSLGDNFNIITAAITTLGLSLVNLIPKLIVAIIIWLVGKFLLDLAVRLLSKINIKGTSMDDRAITTLTTLINIVGKIVLVLIVLDYLGIGRSLVGAVANGLTFAIAIALGLSFGKALEEDARTVVGNLRGFFMQSMKKSGEQPRPMPPRQVRR
ncbi:MAG TPA: hypothetical protein VK338_02780 [Candidatus Nitrosocosmicus sp.]|nr:hypothetical protein [Candidatus Nitrosocosmicus sp.]